MPVVLMIAASLAAMQLGCGEKGAQVPPAMRHIVDAHDALKRGDQAAALVSLEASLEEEPNVWAYFERAKLQLEIGNDEAATADCQKLLEIDPENRDAQWLLAEIAKDPAARFQGRSESPPSASK